MGFQILLLMFAAVTLGGLGTAFGALVGSIVVGLFVTVSTLWIPTELKNVGALGILIVILLVRPQGILGRGAAGRLSGRRGTVNWDGSSSTLSRPASASRPSSSRSRPSASTCTSATPAC